MKKIFLFAIAIFLVTVCKAQDINEKVAAAPKVEFYGIDFSAVNVVGAGETEDAFIYAFDGINQLLISEEQKYDVGKYLGLDIISLQIDDAVSQLSKLKDVRFKNKKRSVISYSDIIASYPTTSENVLLIIAEELNKKTATGTFVAIIFNGETKHIILEHHLSGDAAGFGLRNFWARSLVNGLKQAYR